MVSKHITDLLSLLAHAGPLVYLIALLAAILEGAAFLGLLFPSETVLLIAGATTVHSQVHLTGLIAIATFGAITGDSIGYAMGARLGPGLKATRFAKKVSNASWTRAETLLHRRGWRAVLFGRFVGVLRALVPALAGVLHMPYRKFLLGNALGALIWTPLVILVGHFAAHNLKGAEEIITRSGWTLLAFTALIALGIGWKIRRDRSRDGIGDESS